MLNAPLCLWLRPRYLSLGDDAHNIEASAPYRRDVPPRAGPAFRCVCRDDPRDGALRARTHLTTGRRLAHAIVSHNIDRFRLRDDGPLIVGVGDSELAARLDREHTDLVAHIDADPYRPDDLTFPVLRPCVLDAFVGRRWIS